MPDENVNENEETTDETAEEPATTDAPEGVADVENVPEDAGPEESEASEPEPAGGDEPPGGEPATAEPEEAPEAVGEGPAAEDAPVEEPASEAEPADEPAEGPEAAAVQPEPKKKRKRLPRSLRSPRTRTKRERPAERKAIVRLPKPEHDRGRRQERQGTVVSAAADKTIVVRVDTVKVHPRYKKVIRRSTKLHAHDETNEAKIGDIVRIVETRPLSKLKRWRLQEIVEAAK